MNLKYSLSLVHCVLSEYTLSSLITLCCRGKQRWRRRSYSENILKEREFGPLFTCIPHNNSDHYRVFSKSKKSLCSDHVRNFNPRVHDYTRVRFYVKLHWVLSKDSGNPRVHGTQGTRPNVAPVWYIFYLVDSVLDWVAYFLLISQTTKVIWSTKKTN